MSTIHFYIITIDGKQYRATCPFYQWKKVCEYFKLERKDIRRGAISSLPWYGCTE